MIIVSLYKNARGVKITEMRPIDNTAQVSEKEIAILKRELVSVMGKGVEGDVVEFGCYTGTASIPIAKTLMNYPDRKFYAYDSFEGLPEKSSQDDSALGLHFKAGELLATKKQFVRNLTNAKVDLPKIKKAWFSDLTENDVPFEIAFAFLDGDYYDSIKTSLRLIEDSLIEGSVVIIHDYKNSSLPGVALATNEWLIGKSYNVKYDQSLAIIYI